MKHKLLIAGLVVVCYCCIVWSKSLAGLQKSAHGYTLNFEVPRYQIEVVDTLGLVNRPGYAAETFTRAWVPGYRFTEDVGKPQLPVFRFFMTLTDINQVPTFEVLQPVEEAIPLQDTYLPAQEPWLKTQTIAERTFSIDKEYYASQGKRAPMAVVNEVFTTRGVPCAMITISPFFYDPVERKLTVTKKFTLKINTSTAKKYSGLDSKVFENFLRHMAVNFESTVEPVQGNRNEDYLIITAPNFESDLSEFVSFRQARFNVTMVTTSTTGTNASAIQSYIKGLDPTPAFILLVGDTDEIPPSGGIRATSDIYYSSTEGDYKPEILLGRFSVANSTDLSNAIAKTIFMEQNLGTIAKRIQFIGGADAGNGHIAERTHDYVIDNYTEDAGYENIKQYCNSSSVSESNVVAEIVTGVIFNVYSGHGGSTSMAAGDFSLSVADVHNLSNTTSYPFSYNFACSMGSYTSGQCFSEACIRAENGPVIGIAASMSTSWGPDETIEEGLFDGIFDDQNPVTTVSASLNAGKMKQNSQSYWECYNLMGDPGLEVFPVITYPHVMVSKPNGGEELEQGTSYLIKWSSNVAGNAKIDLFKAGVLNKTIAASTPNNGSYEWDVTVDYAVGNDYKVKVSSIENDTCIDESDDNFSIVEERIYTIPYYQDFNNWSRSTTDYWEQSSDDDLDWTILSGPTPSRDGGYTTGPEGDFPDGSGQYIYIEASGDNYPGKKASIVTPKFNFQQVAAAKLRLYYHMYSGEQVMGDFFVDVQVGKGAAWEEGKISLTGNDYGDNWIEEKLDLNFIVTGNYTMEQKKRVRFRLRGITSDDADEGWSSDISVDSFCIDNVSTGIISGPAALARFGLQYQNSRIRYQIPNTDNKVHVTIRLYSIQGRQIRTLVNEEKKPGSSYYVELGTNAQKLAAGVYLCKMNADSFSKTITLIKK
jgi:hypothetical protein